MNVVVFFFFFFFQAEDGIRDFHVTGVQTCALPISTSRSTRQRRAAATASRKPRTHSAAKSVRKIQTTSTSSHSGRERSIRDRESLRANRDHSLRSNFE